MNSSIFIFAVRPFDTLAFTRYTKDMEVVNQAAQYLRDCKPAGKQLVPSAHLYIEKFIHDHKGGFIQFFQHPP